LDCGELYAAASNEIPLLVGYGQRPPLHGRL
jgi:hypothetical protein